ncbi:MAG: hypothetical protein WKG00_23680 [Polyangiaceae bacterium]
MLVLVVHVGDGLLLLGHRRRGGSRLLLPPRARKWRAIDAQQCRTPPGGAQRLRRRPGCARQGDLDGDTVGGIDQRVADARGLEQRLLLARRFGEHAHEQVRDAVDRGRQLAGPRRRRALGARARLLQRGAEEARAALSGRAEISSASAASASTRACDQALTCR